LLFLLLVHLEHFRQILVPFSPLSILFVDPFPSLRNPRCIFASVYIVTSFL
uniref:Ovule protein n=1 Tax=Taenia asiatica TaxID=60517 RepID=A0A0R3VSD8_TAEAS